MEIKETSQQEGQAVGKDKEKETVKGKKNQGEGGLVEDNTSEVTLMDLMVEDKKKESVIRQSRRLKRQLRSLQREEYLYRRSASILKTQE